MSGADENQGLPKLSIRLLPDGLSFSEGEHAARETFPREGGEGALLDILTVKTVLVPVEVYEPECKAKYFEANSIALSPDDTIVEIPCFGVDAVALAAVDGGMMEDIASRYGDIRMSCPFSQTPPAETEMYITLAKEYSFVMLFARGKLLCAETLPVADFASLLFFANRLTVLNKLGRVKVICRGDGAAAMAENFSGYYTDVEAQ